MPTDRIEIKPGVFIEVSQRLRKKSGIPKGAKLRNRLHDEERKRILGDMVRSENRKVKYSHLLLNEAVDISKTLGVREAVRLTGIKYWSIVGRKRELAAQGKFTPRPKPNSHTRYTLSQKLRCVALAKQIADRDQRGMRPAFIKAGKIMGVNGRSIEWMHLKGMF